MIEQHPSSQAPSQRTLVLGLLAAWAAFVIGVWQLIGNEGLFPSVFAEHGIFKALLYWVILTHITITAMSLSFHRMHTHRGVVFHRAVDGAFQLWLWLTTSMCKLDWVSVHVYHHAHSDDVLDPHSPYQKGLGRVFLLGALDYTRAKQNPEVLKIRNKLKETRFEAFLSRNILLGPVIMIVLYTLAFGPWTGLGLSLMTFATSPIFAVGGVNAIAHAWGYRNYKTKDQSRNIGFLFPLNWMICGELDHNNHHPHPKSCSFRHRWYEFDVGYAYIWALEKMGLAQVKVRAPKVEKLAA
ncbi:MAG: fatty acid desaturase [Proteobacteria bacterium]|nr:MAG: fatty acid desaturase [Pseudomonadota bacterium]